MEYKRRTTGMKTRLLPVITAVCMMLSTVTANAATVMIDPGHGGAGTAGAGAIYPPYMEKSLTLDVANQLCAELNASGISAEMTRTGDTALSLPERAAIAKNSGAKLLVSIHFNASAAHDKSGCAVWTSMFGNHYKAGAECGYDIIMATEMIGLSHAEREIVANIVRFNKTQFRYYNEVATTSLIDKENYIKIAKLSAMFRIADGVCRSYRTKVNDVRFSVKGNELIINVFTVDDIDLEQGFFFRKASLFEEVFSIKPVLRYKRL